MKKQVFWFLVSSVLFPGLCGWFGSRAGWSLGKTLAVAYAIWLPAQALAWVVFGYRGVGS